MSSTAAVLSSFHFVIWSSRWAIAGRNTFCWYATTSSCSWPSVYWPFGVFFHQYSMQCIQHCAVHFEIGFFKLSHCLSHWLQMCSDIEQCQQLWCMVWGSGGEDGFPLQDLHPQVWRNWIFHMNELVCLFHHGLKHVSIHAAFLLAKALFLQIVQQVWMIQSNL